MIAVRFDDSRVTMTISDYGKGFKVPDRLDDLTAMGRLGLVGMQERAQLLGAEFSLHSRVGAGTTITVRVRQSDENPARA